MDVGDITQNTLQVNVELVGVDETKAKLASVGTTGEASATKVDQAFRQNAASAERFRVTLEQQQQAWARSGGSVSSYNAAIADLQREWEATNGTARQSVGAVTQVAVAQETAATNAASHGLQLGRLRQELGTLVGRLTDTSTAVDRMGGALGAMAVGNVIIIGVLAGIAAIEFAWEHLRSDAEKTADAVKKSMKDVGDEILREQLKLGDLQQAQAVANVKKAQDAYDKVKALAGDRTSQNIGADVDPLGAAILARSADSAKKALDKALAELLEFQQRKTQIDTQISYEAQRAETDRLAFLVKSNAATKAERAQAIALEQQYTAEAAKLAVTQTDNVRRSADLQAAQTLHDALNPKIRVQVEGETVARSALSDALSKQLDEMRKVNVEDNIAFLKSAEATALIGKEGEARALLTSRYDAEIERLQAYQSLAGNALTQRLADIDALEREAAARIKASLAVKDQRDAVQLLNEAGKSATDIGARNVKATHDQAVAQQAEYEKIGNALEHDLLRSIDSFSKNGLTSFRSFFQEVESLALRMTAQLDKALTDSAKKLNAGQIAELKEQRAFVSSIGAGIAGGSIGYTVGGAASGGFQGAASGAAAGALAGNEILPGWGAVIGALAGAAGGLLGAADAHRAAAKAVLDASVAFAASLSSAKGTTYGGAFAQQAQLDQAAAAAQALRDQAADLFQKQLKELGDVGKHPDQANAFAKQYEDTLSQINKLEQDRVALLREEIAAVAVAYTGALAVRNLQAAGMVEQAAALRQQLADQQELRDAAAKFGKDSAEYQSTVATQEAEAAARKASQAEADRRSLQDLDVRAAAAGGASDKTVSDMQFALAQERELADLRKSGASDDIIAREQAVLDLEKKARDDAFAQLNVRAQEDYRVRTLEATGHADEAAAIRLQLDQQREYQDAVKQGLDDATLAALALAQAAESAAAAAKRAAEAQRGLEDLAVRDLRATGQNSAADDLAFREKQQREYEDAVAAGKTQDYLDLLKKTLADEATARGTGSSAAAGGGSALNDSYNKTQIGTVTGISDSQALGLLGYAETQTNYLKFLLPIEQHLRFLDSAGGSSAPVLPTGSLAFPAVPAPLGRLSNAPAAQGGQATVVNNNTNYTIALNGQDVTEQFPDLIAALQTPRSRQAIARLNNNTLTDQRSSVGAART